MKSPNKILSIAVLLLLIANIALVFMLMKDKNRHDRRDRKDPGEMMAKELNMTEQQQKDFKQMREEHFKTIKPLIDSMKAAQNAYFLLIKNEGVNDSILNNYQQKVSERKSELDKALFVHFQKVRKMFTPEQQPRFDTLMLKMMERRRGMGSGPGIRP
jgi:periplasmic protein CpxP/Spy